MRLFLITVFTLLFSAQSFAAAMKMVGMKGKASDVTKTIKVNMYDNYYEPKTINVKKGETVRFIVENKGVLVHEFNIATMKMHKKHGPEMLDMMKNEILLPNKINKEKMKQMAKMNHKMAHSHSNSVLLEPKQKAELIWKFTSNAELFGGCNVPGHLEAGMISKININ
ncbi:cupredoxin domain-containing protein [Candidatus Pelagibacter sp. HIMB1517]|uniref:cupredoxin domain-containing protein n=1 Tax=Candidatus Pelagibacter sp. HIMB1517 TaxID=3413341 RepID=UPI003F85A0E9